MSIIVIPCMVQFAHNRNQIYNIWNALKRSDWRWKIDSCCDHRLSSLDLLIVLLSISSNFVQSIVHILLICNFLSFFSHHLGQSLLWLSMKKDDLNDFQFCRYRNTVKLLSTVFSKIAQNCLQFRRFELLSFSTHIYFRETCRFVAFDLCDERQKC